MATPFEAQTPPLFMVVHYFLAAAQASVGSFLSQFLRYRFGIVVGKTLLLSGRTVAFGLDWWWILSLWVDVRRVLSRDFGPVRARGKGRACV